MTSTVTTEQALTPATDVAPGPDTIATTEVAQDHAAEQGHAGFLGDATNWVFISFVIFAVLFVKYGWSKVTAKLDGRIDEIRKELETAEKLKNEAMEMLATYQQRHRDAMDEAAEIATKAKRQAQTIQEKAEADLKETLARREKQLTERLARIEAAAEAELRKVTADTAMKAAEQLIRKGMDAKAQSALADKAISNLSSSLN